MNTNDKGINLFDYLLLLIKWKKPMIISTLIVGVLAVGLSFILPKHYKATVLFLPPSTSSGLASFIQNFSVDLLGGDEITGDVCISILQSRELREVIIEKYDLMKVYKKKYIEHTLKTLDKKVKIETEVQVGIGASNIISISISVIDKSPEQAANIANDLYKLLGEKIIELNTKKAKNNRIFLEERVAENKRDLRNAEDSLNTFQEEWGMIEITTQAKVVIETAAQLKAEILKATAMREALSSNLGQNHAEVLKLENQINALNKEYSSLHSRQSNQIQENDVLLPIGELPGLGLKYYRLFRDVEIQNKLHEMLVPLLEQAKIQEARTIPVLRLLDRAVPPTYKYRPKRALIVVGIVCVYFAFFVLCVFYIEFLNRLKIEEPERYQRIVSLFKSNH